MQNCVLLKNEFIKSSLVFYLGFILVTWSLLQLSLTDFFENNDNILIKFPSIYAQDDDGGSYTLDLILDFVKRKKEA